MTTVSPPTKRRRPTISLRALLIAFTLLALGMGWYANRSLRQRAAVAKTLSKGGRITYAYNDPTVKPAPTGVRAPPWLADYLGIDFVDGVAAVEFIGQEFDDDDLALLDDLPKVRWLTIYETKMTGANFQHVGRRRQLRAIVVDHTPLDDRALAEIGRMHALTTLYLVDTKITDAGLPALKELTKLEALSLSECAITSAGLAKFPLPETLQTLSLENTQIGDDTLAQLEGLPVLTQLTLYGSPVTDECIPVLQRMPALKSVMLGQTKVSDDGLRRLIAARGQALFVSPDPDGKR